LLPVGLLVGGGFWAFNKGKGMVACAMAFENVRDATLDYAKDHKGKLPPAEKWMDEVRPYYQKELDRMPDKDGTKVIGIMPATGAWSCDNGEGGRTGIAFNKALSGKKVDDIKNPETTYLIFETPTASENLTMAYEDQSKESSPKIFNEARGWFKAPVKGDVDTGKMKTRGTRSGRFKIEANESSDKKPDSK
jgi:hypothetical protein